MDTYWNVVFSNGRRNGSQEGNLCQIVASVERFGTYRRYLAGDGDRGEISAITEGVFGDGCDAAGNGDGDEVAVDMESVVANAGYGIGDAFVGHSGRDGQIASRFCVTRISIIIIAARICDLDFVAINDVEIQRLAAGNDDGEVVGESGWGGQEEGCE